MPHSMVLNNKEVEAVIYYWDAKIVGDVNCQHQASAPFLGTSVRNQSWEEVLQKIKDVTGYSLSCYLKISSSGHIKRTSFG